MNWKCTNCGDCLNCEGVHAACRVCGAPPDDRAARALASCTCPPAPARDPKCVEHGDDALEAQRVSRRPGVETKTHGIPPHVLLPLVLEDMRARHELGVQRYGTPLLPCNGRNALVDAYQEALDLAAYLRQAAFEENIGAATPSLVHRPYGSAQQEAPRANTNNRDFRIWPKVIYDISLEHMRVRADLPGEKRTDLERFYCMALDLIRNLRERLAIEDE